MVAQPNPVETPSPLGVVRTWLWSFAILTTALFAYGFAMAGLAVLIVMKAPGTPWPVQSTTATSILPSSNSSIW